MLAGAAATKAAIASSNRRRSAESRNTYVLEGDTPAASAIAVGLASCASNPELRSIEGWLTASRSAGRMGGIGTAPPVDGDLGIGRKARLLSSEEHKYARLRRDLGFQALEPVTNAGSDHANPFCGRGWPLSGVRAFAPRRRRIEVSEGRYSRAMVACKANARAVYRPATALSYSDHYADFWSGQRDPQTLKEKHG
jgi:hypothetical protein